MLGVVMFWELISTVGFCLLLGFILNWLLHSDPPLPEELAEDWSDVCLDQPPMIPFKKLAVGQQFTIPNSNNPAFVFEKLKMQRDGTNARSDIYDRWCSQNLYVAPLKPREWNSHEAAV